MARPKKNEAPDLTQAHELTAGLIERLQCPPDSQQAFLRDIKSPSLRVRATRPSKKNPGGAKAFVFESKLNKATLRITIGDVRTWSIEDARAEANRLRVLVDKGLDPRDIERQKQAEAAAQRAQEAARCVTFGEVWQTYMADRKKAKVWGDRSYESHQTMVAPGGEPRKRWKGKLTVAGPLARFVGRRLADIDAAAVYEMAQAEVASRASLTRHAVRLLSAFFTWCDDQDAYKASVHANAAKGKRLKELLGKGKKRKDVLAREQLPAWFGAMRAIPNAVISAYLQSVLLTGVRREELTALRWDKVDTVWNKMTVRDKIEGEREVPLTPYVKHLISSLPRVNEWVFPSIRNLLQDPKHERRRHRYNAALGRNAPAGSLVVLSASGHIEEPSGAHTTACEGAGITLTLHGLRRSFATLSEWTDMPAGVAAQIQGHAPQGVREQHYIHRPLDILRMHHEKFEAWLLAQAGIDFKATENQQGLRLVASTG